LIFSKLDNLTEYNICKNFLVFLFIVITQDLFYYIVRTLRYKSSHHNEIKNHSNHHSLIRFVTVMPTIPYLLQFHVTQTEEKNCYRQDLKIY